MTQKDREMMVWTQVLSVLMFFGFTIGLVILSVASFFQTESAFRSANDSSIVFFGISFGNVISYAFALLFQYGQNIALFIRKHFFERDEVVFSVWGRDVTQKEIALWVFFFCAGVDSITNIIWFHTTVEPVSNFVINLLLKIVGYSAMVVVVFAEEALGWALDAVFKAFDQLRSAVEYNNRKNKGFSNQALSSRSNFRNETNPGRWNDRPGDSRKMDAGALSSFTNIVEEERKPEQQSFYSRLPKKN